MENTEKQKMVPETDLRKVERAKSKDRKRSDGAMDALLFQLEMTRKGWAESEQKIRELKKEIKGLKKKVGELTPPEIEDLSEAGPQIDPFDTPSKVTDEMVARRRLIWPQGQGKVVHPDSPILK